MPGPSSVTVNSAYGAVGVAAVAGDPRGHRDAGRRMHPGIAEQIADELMQPGMIPADPHRLVGQVLDPMVRRRRDRGVVHRVDDEVGQVDVFGLQIFAFAQA